MDGEKSSAPSDAGPVTDKILDSVESRYRRRFPFCSLLLCIGCITGHSFVYAGTRNSIEHMYTLGASFHGWQSVGSNFSHALDDFSSTLGSVTSTMVTIEDHLVKADEAMSDLLEEIGRQANHSDIEVIIKRLAGQFADSSRIGEIDAAPSFGGHKQLLEQDLQSMLQVVLTLQDSLQADAERTRVSKRADALHRYGNETTELEAVLQPKVDSFTSEIQLLVDLLRPILQKLDKWRTIFQAKTADFINDWSSSLMIAQMVFDQVVNLVSKYISPKTFDSEEKILFHAFNLFDVSNTGLINLQDILDISEMYGIVPLQGEEGVKIVEAYDETEDRKLNPTEFANFVHDPSLPHIMTDILQAYASTLASIAGPLLKAGTRAEVAASVANYIELVSSKNITKMAWIAQAMTNNSLPLSFSVGLMRELVMNAENPTAMSTSNSGYEFVKHMVDQDTHFMIDMVRLASNASFWIAEGFDLEEQDVVVQHITKWMVRAAALGFKQSPGPDFVQSEVRKLTAEMHGQVERSQKKEAQKVLELGQARLDNLPDMTRRLLHKLSVEPLDVLDLDATETIQSGQPAHPETLQFAERLANNASRVASELMSLALDFADGTGQSTPSWAGKIKNIESRVWQFLNTVEKWTTIGGQHMLENAVQDFADNATEEVVAAILSLHKNDDQIVIPGVWSTIQHIIREISAHLPVAIQVLKETRKEISGSAHVFKVTFEAISRPSTNFFEKTGDIAIQMADAYYVIWLLVTIFTTVFNFWGSGYSRRLFREEYLSPFLKRLGIKHVSSESDPVTDVDTNDDYTEPSTFRQRLATYVTSCTACVTRDPVNRPFCFWSVLLLLDALVLITFFTAMAATFFLSVAAFLHSGCQDIPVLEDTVVCTETMQTYASWARHFSRDFVQVPDVCAQEKLTTCQIFKMDLATEWAHTVVGGTIAAFLSLELVLESAILHERARWKQAKENLEKLK